MALSLRYSAHILPVLIVTSESMEPVFPRGDNLFVSNRAPSIELGEIVVCWIEGRRLPFVHRVIEKHALIAGTKGNARYEKTQSFVGLVFICHNEKVLAG